MAKNKYGETGEAVPAVPVHEDAFIGIATNQDARNCIVRAAVDGDVTFHFAGGNKVYSALAAPVDFVTGDKCTGVTSTAEVWIG